MSRKIRTKERLQKKEIYVDLIVSDYAAHRRDKILKFEGTLSEFFKWYKETLSKMK